MVALPDKLRADSKGDALNMTRTDEDVGKTQGKGGVGEGVQSGGGLDDHLQDGGAIAGVIQPQGGSQGGKSPDDTRDSDKQARGR